MEHSEVADTDSASESGATGTDSPADAVDGSMEWVDTPGALSGRNTSGATIPTRIAGLGGQVDVEPGSAVLDAVGAGSDEPGSALVAVVGSDGASSARAVAVDAETIAGDRASRTGVNANAVLTQSTGAGSAVGGRAETCSAGGVARSTSCSTEEGSCRTVGSADSVDGGHGTSGIASTIVQYFGSRATQTVVGIAGASQTRSQVASTATAIGVESTRLTVGNTLVGEEHELAGATGANSGTSAGLAFGIAGVTLTV